MVTLPIDTIIQGDCLEVMQTFPDKSVDLVITDPPYGVRIAEWDKEFSNDWVWQASRVLKEDATLISFCGTKQFPYLAIELDKYFNERNYLVWYSPNKSFYSPRHLLIKTEQAIISRRGYPIFNNSYNYLDLFIENSESDKWGHPSQKPTELIRKLIHVFSSDGDLILDPFLGSGTTAVAAKRLHRHWIGIELSEKYCELARKRVAQCQQPMF